MKAQTERKRAAERFSDTVIEVLAASAPEQFVDESKISALENCLEKLAPQARRTVDLFYAPPFPRPPVFAKASTGRPGRPPALSTAFIPKQFLSSQIQIAHR
ncbi:MAG: hypothetical protein NTW21_35100 [Verrucomicrobia bacterium]|nr:hypothetical protein [Verrucomicrobiota bacterium]